MPISEIYQSSLIIPDAIVFFEKASQIEVIDTLFSAVLDPLQGLEPQSIRERILEREGLSSTCIGAQIAIPHVKVEGLDRFILSLGVHKEGVDWSASDGMGVHLILLILGPDVEPIYYLNYLSSLTRRLKNHNLKEKLMSSQTAQEAFEIFKTEDESWI
ncbi:MAG: PTS sugar transporter subunit IIA [Chlamydiia bacterium]|jgi:PTS system nitrogen regulatory IIA component|nr:PTS sugar transporter subunit IIA [Chlamydiota bacterium]